MQIQNRNIVLYLILTIVTCGIFGIIWAIYLARDAVHVKDEKDDALLEIILMILLPFVGFFLAEKKFAEGCAAKGIPHNDNSIIYLVLGIFGFGIVNYIMMQNDLNKLAPVNQ